MPFQWTRYVVIASGLLACSGGPPPGAAQERGAAPAPRWELDARGGHTAVIGEWTFAQSPEGVALARGGSPVGAIARASLRRGAQELPPRGPFVVHGDVLRARAAAVTEEVERTPLGVEQRWTFDAAPAGSGELSVDLPLRDLTVEATMSGGVLLAPRGGDARVTYSHGVWIDAGGKRTEVPVEVAGGGLRLRVSEAALRDTRWPATLDPMLSPVITPAPVVRVPLGTTTSVAITRGAPGELLVAWTYANGPGAYLWVRRYTDDGVAVDAPPVRVSDAPDATEVRALSGDAAGALVVYRTETGVAARHVGLDARVEGPVVTIPGANELVTASFGGADHLLVWPTSASTFESVRVATDGRLVDTTPRRFGAVTPGTRAPIALTRHGAGHLLVWSPTAVGVSWQLLDATGAPVGAPTRAFPFARQMASVGLASNGAEALVVWNDETTSGSLAPGGYSMRVDASGAALDAAPRPLMVGAAHARFNQGAVAWDGAGMRVLTVSAGSMVVTRLSPTGASTAPTTTVGLPASFMMSLTNLRLTPRARGLLMTAIEPVFAGMPSGYVHACAITADGSGPSSVRLAPFLVAEAAQAPGAAGFDGTRFFATWGRVDLSSGAVTAGAARISRDGRVLDPIPPIGPGPVPIAGAAGRYVGSQFAASEWSIVTSDDSLVPQRTSTATLIGSPWSSVGTTRVAATAGPDGFLLAIRPLPLATASPFKSARVRPDGTLLPRAAVAEATAALGPIAVGASRTLYAAAWHATGALGNCYLFLRRHSPAGDLLEASPLQVFNNGCTGALTEVASQGDTFLVARRLTTSSAVETRTVAPDGTLSPIRSMTLNGVGNFKVAHDGVGYLIAWWVPSGPTNGVYIQRFDPATGTLAGTALQVTHARSTAAPENQWLGLGSDGQGRTLVSWTEESPSPQRMFARIFVDDGAPALPDGGVDVPPADASGPDVVGGDGPSMDTSAPPDGSVPADVTAADVPVDRAPTDVALDARADVPADLPDDVADDRARDASPDATADDVADVPTTEDATDDAADAAAGDAGSDAPSAAEAAAGEADASNPAPPSSSGCGCRATGEAPAGVGGPWVGALLVALRRRARRRS